MHGLLGLASAGTFAEVSLSLPRPRGCGACASEPYPDLLVLARETAVALQQGAAQLQLLVEVGVRTCHWKKIWNVLDDYCAPARVACGVFVHLSQRLNASSGSWEVVKE